MQKALVGIIVALIIALILFLIGAVVVSRNLPRANEPTGTNTTGGSIVNPGSTSGGSGAVVTPGQQASSTAAVDTITVATNSGQTITVEDFSKKPGVEKDTTTEGYYYVAGGKNPSGVTTPYSIIYIQADQSFTITLLREPIGDLRRQAEQELMQKLGISESSMCQLRYWVGVPDAVNTIYSGKNLGFSFCPGATKL